MDWEQRYQNHDTPWDKNAMHPFLPKAWEILKKISHVENSSESPRWLYPGCGTGIELPYLAAAQREIFPESAHPSLIAVDLAPTALNLARAHCANVPANLEFLLGNVLDLPLADASISLVWEHTCLCALAPEMRAGYVSEIARILPDGGLYAGFFFTHMEQDRPGPPWNCEPAGILALLPEFQVIHEIFPLVPTFPARVGEESFLVFRKCATV